MKKLLPVLFLISFMKPAIASVTYMELQSVFKIFHEIYDPLINGDEIIEFNRPTGADMRWWDIDVFRASYHGYLDNDSKIYHHLVWVFGGLAKRPFMTIDGLALIVCHELGHGFGGPPYKNSGSSTEGQADYYATEYCLQEFFMHWPAEVVSDHLPSNIKERCADDQLCLRAFVAVENRISHFWHNEGIKTSLTETDPTVVDLVDTSDTFYPSHQCRIDTHRASILKEPRPRCWYVE